MSSLAFHLNAKKERHFLLHLDSPERDLVDDGLVVTGFVQDESDVREQLGVRIEELFASVQTSELFIGDAEVDDVALERNAAALQVDHRHHLGDSEGLDVERSAPPDVAARSQSAERRLRPLVRRDWYDVDVMEQQQRFLVRAGREPRVDRLPCRIRSDQPRVDPLFREDLLQKTRACCFVAGRIRRVDAQIRDQRVFRFAIERILLGRRSAFAVEGKAAGDNDQR